MIVVREQKSLSPIKPIQNKNSNKHIQLQVDVDSLQYIFSLHTLLTISSLYPSTDGLYSLGGCLNALQVRLPVRIHVRFRVSVIRGPFRLILKQVSVSK